MNHVAQGAKAVFLYVKSQLEQLLRKAKLGRTARGHGFYKPLIALTFTRKRCNNADSFPVSSSEGHDHKAPCPDGRKHFDGHEIIVCPVGTVRCVEYINLCKILCVHINPSE